jgi:hypothetical protein
MSYVFESYGKSNKIIISKLVTKSVTLVLEMILKGIVQNEVILPRL